MALNIFYIKKWYKMIVGKSILHVDQPAGKLYSKTTIKGYYNDLREKVIKENIDIDKLPKTELPNGKKIDFSIAIFQYGLGAYDLYLETNQKDYYLRFMKSVIWAEKHQDSNGGWKTFIHEANNPYSSMAQGEGISLLLRAYQETKKNKYLNMATKAINFMQKNIDENGCAEYNLGDIYLKEFPEKSTVLNGWIFSLFGIYDYLLLVDDCNIKSFFDSSLQTLIKRLPDFDNGYWSKYDLSKKIASPFYHNLHIELLLVLYELTGEKALKKYSKKFAYYNNKKINKIFAFIRKAIQKIIERE